MNTIRCFAGAVAGVAMGLAFGLSAAQAANFRSAVSVSGVDSNPCTPAAPCRTISYALTQTSVGGELFVLSSGGYGPFTISQAITIIAPTGVIAAVSAPSGNGITVAAGATDLVQINGFLIDGLNGAGTNGIQVDSVGSLSVGATQITGFSNQGINFTANAGAGSTTLILTDSTLFQNTVGSLNFAPVGGAASNAGRVFVRSSGFVTSPATFDASNANGPVSAQIHDTRIRNNAGVGVSLVSGSNVPVQVQIDHANIYSVTSAFSVSGSASFLTLAASSLSKVSTVSTTAGGGTVISYGDNHMAFYTTLGPIGTRALQ